MYSLSATISATGMPPMMDLVLRQQRLIRDDATDLVLTGDVLVRENTNDARQGRSLGNTQPLDPRVGNRSIEGQACRVPCWTTISSR
jgi:hypothetical protein